jgi:hypothetical protein
MRLWTGRINVVLEGSLPNSDEVRLRQGMSAGAVAIVERLHWGGDPNRNCLVQLMAAEQAARWHQRFTVGLASLRYECERD